MRELTDAARVRDFMRALGRQSRLAGRVYLVGGACAVLLDWRQTTIDIDLELDAALQPLLRDVPDIKESLRVNVELAAPSHFIPELPGWRERSPFIVREGLVDFHHYDFYAQALSKLERAHTRDLTDVDRMSAQALITPARLWSLFETIEPDLFKYPAIHPPTFRSAVEHFIRRHTPEHER
jgi:hypothetical protein